MRDTGFYEGATYRISDFAKNLPVTNHQLPVINYYDEVLISLLVNAESILKFEERKMRCQDKKIYFIKEWKHFLYPSWQNVENRESNDEYSRQHRAG